MRKTIHTLFFALLFAALAAVAFTPAGVAAPKGQPLSLGEDGFRPERANWLASVRTIQLSDNFFCFYTGRDGKMGYPMLSPDDDNWGQFDLWLGIASYALVNGKEAVIFDTLLLPEYSAQVRSRLEAFGVEKFTVINTHMDMDHTGGNEVYKDSTIIASKGANDALNARFAEIEAGTLWGPPATNPLILPNQLIAEDTELTLAGFKIQLFVIDAHEDGGVMCAYIPALKALIVGDLAEDNVVLLNVPGDIKRYIAETQRLLDMDLDYDYVFPGHAAPDRIARGEYNKRFIESALVYQQRLLEWVDKPDYLKLEMKDFLGEFFADGTLEFYEPYVYVHQSNAEAVHKLFSKNAKP